MAKKEIESPSTSLDYLHWWEDNSQPQQPHTFGNILSAIKGGIGNSYDMVDIDRKLNSLWDEYNLDPNVTPERKAEIEREFVDEYVKAKDLAKQQLDTIDWLQKSDSKIAQIGSHAFSAGTSLNSMAMQYGLQGASAAVGGVLGGALATPETGGLGTMAGARAGAQTGWDLAAIPASMYANYKDADDAARAVRERVMLATGDVNLAQQAYEEARLPNMVAVAPSVLVDALTSKYIGGAIGNLAGKSAKVGRAVNRMSDMMEAVRGTRLARGLQRVADTPVGTAIGRATNAIDNFDIPNQAGAWVAGKLNSPLAGKGVRGGLALLGELGSEEFQEGEQGVSEDIAFENAMHKFDPTNNAQPEGWTANRLRNWMNSDEGKLTMLDTAVSTLLTGSANTALGGFARLNDGYNNKYNLRNIDNLSVEMAQGGILSNINPETLSLMKNAIGSAYGMNEQETAALSQDQVMRLWLEDASERAQKQKGMNEEEASAYAVNDFINNATGFVGRPDYTSETSEAYFNKYKVQKTEGLIDRATRQREELKALEVAPTTVKESHEGTIVDDTTPYTQKREQENNGTPITPTQQTSNNLQSIVTNLLPDGQVWTVDNTTSTGNEYADNTVIVKNGKTNKVVRVDRAPDGKSLFVTDITPQGTTDENSNAVQVGNGVGRNSRRVEGLTLKFTTDAKGYQNLGKFFLDNQTNTKTLKQESDGQEQQVAPPDPNRRRVMANGVNDLANFYRQNSDLMDRDTFMLTVKGMMAYGNGNVSLDLDLENKNGNIVGEVTTVQDGVSKAIIHLYSGADAITVLHEFAHVGYDMMSEHEQQLFNRMAEMSQVNFVASMLKQTNPYYMQMEDDEIIGLIRQAVESGDGRVWQDINNVGVLRQTIDILNGGADEEQHQKACEERYAWEFTMWYVEGYTKGKQPTNRMQNMLNRTCGTLGKALELIGSVAERLQSSGWQAISNKSMVSMFENMNTRQFNTGDPNTQRMYGGYMTGAQQEQLQRERELAEQQAQQRAAMEQTIAEQYNGSPSVLEQLASNDPMQPSLFSPEYMQPEQSGTPTYVQLDLFANNYGNTPNVVATNRNRQRREQDLINRDKRMQPNYLNELNKRVNKGESVTQDELQMVMSLNDDNYGKYAKKILGAQYPNMERLELLFYLDPQRGNKFADRIQKKMQVLQTKEDRQRTNKLERENDRDLTNTLFPTAKRKKDVESVEQTRKNRTQDKEVVDSLETLVENRINNIVNTLIDKDQKGEKSLNGYINLNKDKFERVHVYKEALKRFNKNRERYKDIRRKENERFEEQERKQKEEELQKYLSQNEDGIQDKYKKLMDKYEKDGLEAVKNTMKSPAVKKDPRLWNEAYRRLEGYIQQREEQKKAEEQLKQAVKEKAFENDVQKVVELLNEKLKKSENSLKMFLVRNSKKFKEDPIYAEAKKRFEEGRQTKEETTQEQVQEENEQPKVQPEQPKVQPKEQEEVQQQEQVQPASQTVQTEEAQPVVKSEKEETVEETAEVTKPDKEKTTKVEEPKVKEETTNGKTEDSGRVEDIRGTEGTLQEGRSNGVSTSERPVLRPDRRDSVETTEAGNGESVPLLTDKRGKLIGRQIPKVNDKRASADTKKILKAAYSKEQPLQLEGFVNIDNSTNQNGDKGVQIYNKLFGTKHTDDTKVYVHRSGRAGFAVDKDGYATVNIRKGEKGLLNNVLVIARVTDGVNNILSENATPTDVSVFKASGYEPVGVIKENGKDVIVFRKSNQTADEIIKEFDNKDRKRTKIEDLPLFGSRDEYKNYNVVRQSSAKRNGQLKDISQEKKIEINTTIGEATAKFPSTSDGELKKVVDYADGVLNDTKSSSQMGTEKRYFFETLRSAAQEELDNRKKDIELDEDGLVANGEALEGGVLNTVADAENLYEERMERQKAGEEDVTTSEEILEAVGELEEEVEPINVDEALNTLLSVIDNLETDSTKEEASQMLKTVRSDIKAYNGEKKTTEDKKAIFERIERKLKELLNKLFENTMQESDEVAESLTEEESPKATIALPADKNISVTDYNYDNTHKIVTGDLIVGGKKYKGLTSKENTTVTEAKQIIQEIKDKYNNTYQNIMNDFVDMDEEDKVKLGQLYRKLVRANSLIHDRFVKGLYGTRRTKDNPNPVYGHAVSYIRNKEWNFRRSLLGTVKKIMDRQLVYDYKYGFDEVDTAKKLTPANAKKARAKITELNNKIENLALLRRNSKETKERRAMLKKMRSLRNELYEWEVMLWSHGQDYRGNSEFQDEHASWAQLQWQKQLRELQRQQNRASGEKDLTTYRQRSVRNALKRAEEQRNKSTPVLDTEVNTNEAQLQDQESWKKFFNGFKKNIEPLYKNARQNLKSLDDILKFRTLKEMVKLNKAGKDVEGMFNNVEHLVNEAEKNGHLSKELANEHREKINDMRNAYLKETGQDDKVVETKSKQPTVKEQTTEEDTTQYAPSNKETKKRANQITKELEEVAKPYFAVGVTDIGGGAVSKQMLEDAIRVSVPMKKLINKYFGKNVDYSQISKEEAACLDRMNTILDKIKEIKKHYDNLKKGKFTPMFNKSNQTTTKPNRTESKTKPKPTTKVTAEKQQKSSATLDAKQFDNLVKGLFSQLDKNKEALRNTSVQKIVDGIQKGGVVLTPKQVKSIENRLSMRQERLQLNDNKTKTATKQNKPNKSTKSRHMETDVIPDTSVEENRDINSITFTRDALKESKVNRDRAKTLHDNNKYWKETKNPDGSITYTRLKRLPWHTKAVTYSGINGKEVSKEPLGKISEGFQRVWNWYKEKWLNEQTAIKDLAESVGAPEAWMDFVVQKDMGSLGMTAIERGIVKHNSKTKERTAALMDFAKEFKDENEQLDWLDYCEAIRIVHDLHPKGIEQKMTLESANRIINNVKNSANAKRFEEWRLKFVEYNKELLHVLVDGNIITEDLYQKLIKEHPNFIPLSKDMSDFDEAMSFMSSHKDLLNVKSPLHRIGSSLREVKNPLLEMQKRTMDYYQRAAQNKAALTFIDKIVTKITKLANGDEVMLNQAILHKLAPLYTKKGTIKDISDPNKGIFYVMRNGKKEFYQLSDASVYKALRSLSYEHMGGFEKFINFLLSKPAQVVRTMATITFDFAIGNLYRDAGEAFMTSRHGYLPLYDSFWGMWQMYNDTEWFKEYNSQVGDMTSRMRENGRIAGIEDDVTEKLFRIPVIGHIARAMNTFNEYMEQGTRIGEYKNARMGYEGTLGRLRGESANLAKATKSKEYAAFRAKDITLNFLQHGAWGKKFNRVTPFFNASLQGQYKIINTIDEMIHNKEGMRNEMILKAALIAYLSFMTGWNGAGDDDYEEAPDWERDNYTIRGDGSRTPKDQVLGKLIGNPFELLGYYAKKGKFKNDAIDTLVDELKALALPDNLTPAFINLWIGFGGGHDTFRGKQIVPEYMKDDLGYLQKDLSTSNFAVDLSRFAYDTFGIDVSAKKLDWSINQFLSNTGKYWNKIWDTARTEVTGEKNERTGHMYMEEDSKGAADYLNYLTGNNIIDGTLDLARMAFGKKFIQNQTTFDSLQDFNEEYLRLKKLLSDPERMTKEEDKAYETIYKPAYDRIKKNRSKLSEIGKNSSLDKNQKLVKSRPIILDSIKAARDAEKAANKLLKK